MVIGEAMALIRGAPDVAEATLTGRTTENAKLHFSSFKNPFNLFTPKVVH
jgi:hypothetical protein